MHIDPQILFSESKCYACLGITQEQALRLALIARSVVALDAQADVTPAYLLDYAKCYACYGFSTGELLELALLDMFSQLQSVEPPPEPPAAPESPNIEVTSANGDTRFVWTNPEEPDTNQIWTSSDGISFTYAAEVDGSVSDYVDGAVLAAGEFLYFKVRACNGVSCSDFSDVRSVVNGLNLSGTGATSIDYPTLVISYDTLNFNTMASLDTISLPLLVQVSGNLLFRACPTLDSATFPSLQTITGNTQFDNNAQLDNIDLTSLTTVGSFLVASSLPALANLPLISLTSVSEIALNNSTGLEEVDLGALVSLGGPFAASGCTNLASITINTWPQADGANFNSTNCSLNQATVDNILSLALNTATLTTSIINLSGGANATPSAQGLSDKADLISNGCTVLTN